MNKYIEQWRAPLRAWWHGRAPREQRALRLLAIFLALALGAQTLWSLETQRRKLLQQAPVAAAQARRMDALFAEWRELSAAEPAPAASGEALRAAVARRAADLGPQVTTAWTEEGELRVEGTLGFDRWVRWVAAVQTSERLYVASADLSAVPGGVHVEARLVPPR